MNNVSPNKVGLVLGGMQILAHLIWSLLAGLGWAKPFLDWIFGLHFVTATHTVNAFSFSGAILLVVVAGIFGYIVGFILGWLWNMVGKVLGE